MKNPENFTDERIEKMIAAILRAGVAAAAVIVLAGGAVFLARHGFERPDYHIFHGLPADHCTVCDILFDAVTLRGRGLIGLGLLVLIATPVARVAASAFAFFRQRDLFYFASSALVLCILLFSLAGGLI
jgi:uncharacterized membrane protein